MLQNVVVWQIADTICMKSYSMDSAILSRPNVLSRAEVRVFPLWDINPMQRPQLSGRFLVAPRELVSGRGGFREGFVSFLEAGAPDSREA